MTHPLVGILDSVTVALDAEAGEGIIYASPAWVLTGDGYGRMDWSTFSATNRPRTGTCLRDGSTRTFTPQRMDVSNVADSCKWGLGRLYQGFSQCAADLVHPHLVDRVAQFCVGWVIMPEPDVVGGRTPQEWAAFCLAVGVRVCGNGLRPSGAHIMAVVNECGWPS